MVEILIEVVKSFAQRPDLLFMLCLVMLFLLFIARLQQQMSAVIERNTKAFARFEAIMERWELPHD